MTEQLCCFPGGTAVATVCIHSSTSAGFSMGQLQTVLKSAVSDKLAENGLWIYAQLC